MIRIYAIHQYSSRFSWKAHTRATGPHSSSTTETQRQPTALVSQPTLIHPITPHPCPTSTPSSTHAAPLLNSHHLSPLTTLPPLHLSLTPPHPTPHPLPTLSQPPPTRKSKLTPNIPTALTAPRFSFAVSSVYAVLR